MDKAFDVGLMIGIAALFGALGMGIATGKAVESISRKHEEYPRIRRAYMLALIFIETVIIYVLLTAILTIFV